LPVGRWPTSSNANGLPIASAKRRHLPSEQRILSAAAIKAEHPMAHADAFAAATAAASDATLLTGDPELLVDDASWRWEDLRDTTNR
jgi:hypothetical protein